VSKAVLLSVRPEWCEKILCGEKTVEVRKTAPKLETPFKVYLYCTKGDRSDAGDDFYIHPASGGPSKQANGRVFGEFVCDEIYPIRVFEDGGIQDWNRYELQRACVPYEDVAGYVGHGNDGYGWHISELKIYDRLRWISDLDGWTETRFGVAHDPVRRAPQSWCYVKGPREGR